MSDALPIKVRADELTQIHDADAKIAEIAASGAEKMESLKGRVEQEMSDYNDEVAAILTAQAATLSMSKERTLNEVLQDIRSFTKERKNMSVEQFQLIKDEDFETRRARPPTADDFQEKWTEIVARRNQRFQEFKQLARRNDEQLLAEAKLKAEQTLKYADDYFSDLNRDMALQTTEKMDIDDEDLRTHKAAQQSLEKMEGWTGARQVSGKISWLLSAVDVSLLFFL